MQAIIYQPRKHAKRIKVYIPYKAVEWRQQMKAMPTSFFHYPQKLWSVVNTANHMKALTELFGACYELQMTEEVVSMPKVTLTEQAKEALAKYEEKIILCAHSENTLLNYRPVMIYFFAYFSGRDFSQITKDEIESYVYHLKIKGLSNNKCLFLGAVILDLDKAEKISIVGLLEFFVTQYKFNRTSING